MKRYGLFLVALCGISAAHAGGYHANASRSYRVDITNITKGLSFTPFIAATHRSNVSLFELGQAASTEMAVMAEGGDIGPLNTWLQSQTKDVHATASTAGLLAAGQTVSFTIDATGAAQYLSVAAMLLPTNDSFTAVNGLNLPLWGSKTVLMQGYDAGSELNDELCVSIPGPTCGGEGVSAAAGEGYVYISPGIHGAGDVSVQAYDWRGSVAKITVTRMH
jgi:hypothetical protein